MKKPALLASMALIMAATWTHAQTPEPAGAERAEVQAYTEADLDLLYTQVEQAREDLTAVLRMVGVDGEHSERRGEHGRRGSEGRGEHAESGGSEGRGEHGSGNREGRGEHGRAGREGSGEHAEGREGQGEEGGQRLRRNEVWDATRNGARLVLAYDRTSQSFKGRVQNTTREALMDVRVEVHLSNGVELGPTRRVDLQPGQSVPVELSAAGQRFAWWTTHPEHGNEEGHGPNYKERESEHGDDEFRPQNPDLRPLYNQLMLLQQELRMLRAEAERRSRD